jgi:hypothetical protein
MKKQTALMSFKKTSAILQAAVIASAALLPAMLLNGSASGAQLSNRFIDMSASQTSDGSGRDGGDAFGQNVTYTVAFDLGTAHTNLEGIVIQFCADSPIIGDTCTDASTEGFSLSTPTVSGNTLGGARDIDPSAWTVGGDNTDYIILSDATGVSGSLGDKVVFDIDGITNPTSPGSFYARITTYTDSTVAAAYTTATSPGAFVDDGGIALAVANELTVTARVQEVLEFCIGTDTASTGLGNVAGDDCTDVAGTDLSLGVVDSNSVATTSNIDVPNDGVALVRTNASNGAVLYYKAEQDTSSGKLKIAGGTCVGTNLDDPCFNSTGTTQSAIVAGTENFGMTLRDRNTTSGGATNALACDANYDGDGSCGTGAVTGYAWLDTGAFDTIASSTGPIDDEKVSIEFAATASPTTPTGLYTVTANFVATSTF